MNRSYRDRRQAGVNRNGEIPLVNADAALPECIYSLASSDLALMLPRALCGWRHLVQRDLVRQASQVPDGALAAE